jgi:hypothetical protein
MRTRVGRGGPPPKKRRRVGQERVEQGGSIEDVEMEDGTRPTHLVDEDPLLGKRPVILETAKESYLLSPSIQCEEEGEGEKRQMYDLALILEAEVVVEEEVVAAEPAEREGRVGRDETPVPILLAQSLKDGESRGVDVERGSVPLKMPVSSTTTTTTEPVHSPEPTDVSDLLGPDKPASGMVVEEEGDAVGTGPGVVVDGAGAGAGAGSGSGSGAGSVKASSLGGGGPPLSLQVLQRNFTREMFRFEDEGVYVLDPGAGAGAGAGVRGAGAGGGMGGTEWVIQVKSWRWAPG